MEKINSIPLQVLYSFSSERSVKKIYRKTGLDNDIITSLEEVFRGFLEKFAKDFPTDKIKNGRIDSYQLTQFFNGYLTEPIAKFWKTANFLF